MKRLVVIAAIVAFFSLGTPLLTKMWLSVIPNLEPKFATLASFAIAENVLLVVLLISEMVRKRVKEEIKRRNKKAAREALGLYGKAIVDS